MTTFCGHLFFILYIYQTKEKMKAIKEYIEKLKIKNKKYSEDLYNIHLGLSNYNRSYYTHMYNYNLTIIKDLEDILKNEK